MTLKALSLKINAPTESIPFGRGFYQLEEEILYLPVEYGASRASFFSYLESDRFIMHIDKNGRLLFIELDLPRRRWIYNEDLVAPEQAEPADIRFLDFRDRIAQPDIFCNKSRETIMIRFSLEPAARNYFLSENLIAQVTQANSLVSIWAFGLVDDLAGREIASWRKSVSNPESGLSPSQMQFIKQVR